MASRSSPPTLPSQRRIVAYTLQGATLVLLVSVVVVLWTVDASTLTVVVATHDLSLESRFTRVIRLEDGNVV